MHRSISFALPLALAFVAGAAFAPLAQRLLPSAQAQTSAAPPALTPTIIDVAALKVATGPRSRESTA